MDVTIWHKKYPKVETFRKAKKEQDAVGSQFGAIFH
jgi:hypothetical protein